jgi:predicted O-linked N-acetylglucosamine transferase (SPINDLY family)
MVAVPSCWLALIRCIRCKLACPECALDSNNLRPHFSPQPAKITGSLFAQWLDILRQIPHAILWLTTVAEGSAHATRLRGEAAARGIFAKRLIFPPSLPSYLPREKYLQRLRVADLALDTWPFNSGSVGVEALQLGVPLITLVGETVASRMGSSLLRSAFRGVKAGAGAAALLTAWTRRSLADAAVGMISKPRVLKKLRQQLASDGGALFDTSGRAGDLERAARLSAELRSASWHAKRFHLVVPSK